MFPTQEAPARRLVLFLDGTANGAFTQRRLANGMKIIKPTNVLKLARAVVPWDGAGREQVVYYDTGVGSLALYPGFPNRALRLTDMFWGALGAGFQSNVEEALHFLALNYRPKDEVFVFGFSRGAATAQALTRFLDWSGGLPIKRDAYFLPHLFRFFLKFQATRPVEEAIAAINEETRKRESSDGDAEGRRDVWPELAKFQPVTIRFLGVWDTVMALGSRMKAVGNTTTDSKNGFYRTPEPPRCVQHARHAIAIDERRFDFRPEIWQGVLPGQTLEQRWFPGVHSNVGGSYPKDGLANISFHWMVEQAAEHGLQVDAPFTDFYEALPHDRLYNSHRWYYVLFEAARLRLGRGRRSLLGLPPTANARLDRSVIQRMLWTRKSPGKHGMKRLYRPRNVIAFLSFRPDVAAYLRTIGCTDAEVQQFMEGPGKRLVSPQKPKLGAKPATTDAAPPTPLVPKAR